MRVLESGWLTTGKECEEFEKEFAEYVGAKHAVFVSSGTAALELSLACFKKNNPSDEYRAFVPSFTFAATAQAPLHQGFKVKFGDINMSDFCLNSLTANPEQFEVFIPVHLFGNEALVNSDIEHKTIYDSAHRITRGGHKGAFSCYSFYVTKNMTTGEGGMITTNSEDDALWLRKARHHGISKDGWKRFSSNASPFYDIEFLGWKANNTDIAAAIGRVQLAKLDALNNERDVLVKYYNEKLGYTNKGNHLYPVFVKDQVKFITAMAKKGIKCSVHYTPVHQLHAFEFIHTNGSVPNTDLFGVHCVSLPLYPYMAYADIDYVIDSALSTNQLLKIDYGNHRLV